MENALNVYYLWQYKYIKKRHNLKWGYVKKRDEFVTKFRSKYPEITDVEIANFFRIYLKYEPAENNYEKGEFYFDNWIWISRICFMSAYLKERGDYNYTWMIENDTSGIHFP